MKRGVFPRLVIGALSLAAMLAYALPMTIVAPPAADGAALLAQRPLLIPVAGVRAQALVDTFEQGRPGHRHEAIDIPAPRGTAVHAVDDGKVAKLFTSVPGGLTVYHFDPTARLAYYYAHLDRYAPGLKEGMPLRRGDVIGYVGSTGNASPDAPHLHFAVFRLGPLKQWWKGDAVNPYPALQQAATAVAARQQPASGLPYRPAAATMRRRIVRSQPPVQAIRRLPCRNSSHRSKASKSSTCTCRRTARRSAETRTTTSSSTTCW